MLRGLGRAVWSQTRDMQVFNYPRAMLYEIRTADGNVWLKFCKTTESWTVGKQKQGDIHDVLIDSPPQPSPLGMLYDIKSCCR